VSLLLAGLIVAGTSGALFVGRWLAKRRGEKKPEEPGASGEEKKLEAKSGEGENVEEGGGKDERGERDERDERKKEETKDAKAKKPAKRQLPPGNVPHLDGFPCQLGDVIMRLTGEEAWLAGGVVLSEEVPVAALFVAPDAGHDCAIYVRPKPREAVVWCEPLDANAVLVGGEPPSSIEQGGIRFDRVRRLPLRPRRVGVGAPDLGDAVVVAEYASAGAERLLVFKATSGTTRAYRGDELESSSYEVIPSGRSTLDE
jgi:hypothetical protein